MLKIFSRNFVCFASGDNKNRADADKVIVDGKKTIKSSSPQGKAFQYRREDSFYNERESAGGIASHAYLGFSSGQSQVGADKGALEMRVANKQQATSKIAAALKGVAVKALYGIQKGFGAKESYEPSGAKKIVANASGAYVDGNVKENTVQPRQEVDEFAIKNKNDAARLSQGGRQSEPKGQLKGNNASTIKFRATEKAEAQQTNKGQKAEATPAQKSSGNEQQTQGMTTKLNVSSKMQRKIEFEETRFNKTIDARKADFANKEAQRRNSRAGAGGAMLH